MTQELSPFYKSPTFYFQVLTHASLIPMFMYASWYQWVIAFLIYAVFWIVGMGAWHRLFTHKSFVAPTWFENLGLVVGTLSGIGSSIQWVAVHRKHHRFSDTDEDPHNPKGRFLTIQFLVMLVQSSARYIPDLLRSKKHLWFHHHYWKVHAAYALLLLLISPFALVYAYLIPALFQWHAMASLATFSHMDGMGTQNYPNADKSQNLRWANWLLFGDGYHNNHHGEASNYRFNRKPGEWDLVADFIDLIRLDKNEISK